MRLFAGQSAWVVQRLSALVLLVLLVLAIATLLLKPPGYEAWRALVGNAHAAVLIAIGFMAMAVHGWIGARDIVLDYIARPALRLAVLAIVGVLLTGVVTRVTLTLARTFGNA